MCPLTIKTKWYDKGKGGSEGPRGLGVWVEQAKGPRVVGIAHWMQLFILKIQTFWWSESASMYLIFSILFGCNENLYNAVIFPIDSPSITVNVLLSITCFLRVVPGYLFQVLKYNFILENLPNTSKQIVDLYLMFLLISSISNCISI